MAHKNHEVAAEHWGQEKRELYIRFDKDKHEHAHKEAMKFNFKIESLQALND